MQDWDFIHFLFDVAGWIELCPTTVMVCDCFLESRDQQSTYSVSLNHKPGLSETVFSLRKPGVEIVEATRHQSAWLPFGIQTQ